MDHRLRLRHGSSDQRENPHDHEQEYAHDLHRESAGDDGGKETELERGIDERDPPVIDVVGLESSADLIRQERHRERRRQQPGIRLRVTLPEVLYGAERQRQQRCPMSELPENPPSPLHQPSPQSGGHGCEMLNPS